jgi:hypothetical protein
VVELDLVPLLTVLEVSSLNFGAGRIFKGCLCLPSYELYLEPSLSNRGVQLVYKCLLIRDNVNVIG